MNILFWELDYCLYCFILKVRMHLLTFLFLYALINIISTYIMCMNVLLGVLVSGIFIPHASAYFFGVFLVCKCIYFFKTLLVYVWMSHFIFLAFSHYLFVCLWVYNFNNFYIRVVFSLFLCMYKCTRRVTFLYVWKYHF